MLCFVLAACGKDITAPADPVVLPFPQFTHDGILRFTLSSNCPEMDVAFGIDIFWYGPEHLKPGQHFDYQTPEGTYSTGGKNFPTASVNFVKQSVTGVAEQRVERVLSCG